MISISTQASGSSILFYEDRIETKLREASARVQRRATLDGGTSVTLTGAYDGDRTFLIYARVSEAEATTLWGLYDDGVKVFLSCSQGFFLGVIARIKLDNGDLYLEFWVQEKKST